ncbi:hypothetical protein GCM10010393_29550 [Streptomyces gobitricini]|uniref:Uncharacterized protein n=1 Tax=Streptomyces gobitricini TaxID=68211 RepID=A0ABN3M483_9ACTN
MDHAVVHTAIPLFVTGALLLSGAAASVASPAEEPLPADDAEIVMNDGRVIGVNDTVDFSFEGDKKAAEPKSVKGDMSAMACPEVNDPPKYTVKGSPTSCRTRRSRNRRGCCLARRCPGR